MTIWMTLKMGEFHSLVQHTIQGPLTPVTLAMIWWEITQEHVWELGTGLVENQHVQVSCTLRPCMVLFITRYHSFKERSSTGGSDDISVYISVGVCGTVVIVITSTVSVICVTTCLKKRKSKANNTYVMTLSDNIAYTVTSTSSKDKETDTTYDYVYAAEQNYSSIITSQNVAYETSVVPVSNNPSYGIMHQWQSASPVWPWVLLLYDLLYHMYMR